MKEPTVRKLGRAALGVLQPARCLGCDAFLPLRDALGQELEDRRQALTDVSRWFCCGCQENLETQHPTKRCASCALPRATSEDSSLEENADWHCPSCSRELVAWRCTRAWANFGGPARDAILRCKLQGDAAILPGLASLLAHHLRHVDPPSWDGEGITWVPIPITPQTLRRRGFNQSMRLAQGLAKRLGGEVQPVLVRSQEGTPQRSLSRADRQQNLQGAFAFQGRLNPSARVVLVDDVMTTGATLHQAYKVLSEASVKVVGAAVVARTP